MVLLRPLASAVAAWFSHTFAGSVASLAEAHSLSAGSAGAGKSHKIASVTGSSPCWKLATGGMSHAGLVSSGQTGGSTHAGSLGSSGFGHSGLHSGFSLLGHFGVSSHPLGSSGQ